MKINRPPLPALTGARFFAALAVFLFHYSDGFNGALRSVIEYGYIGVSFFFVLSGFILAYNYADKGINLKKFWVARFARIYPVYILAVGLGLLILFLAPHSAHSARYSVPLWLELILESSLLQAWTPWTYCGINCSGWSLSAEAFFYLCFPFAIVIMSKWSDSKLVKAIPFFWLLAIAIPVMAMVVNPALVSLRSADADPALDMIIYNPALNLPQFLLGVCAGLLFLRRSNLVPYANYGSAILTVTAASFTGFIAGLMVLLPRQIPEILVRNGLFAPIFALLIYSIARDPHALFARVMTSKPFVVLGEASYAVYILQVGIFEALHALGFIQFVMAQGPIVFGVSVLLITVLISILTFYLIETPARKLITNLLLGRSKPTTPAPQPKPGHAMHAPVVDHRAMSFKNVSQ